jgi:hypothetical protein
MTVNQSPYFATLYSCTSPWHLLLDAFTHAQLSVISGESPAFYPPFQAQSNINHRIRNLSKESFQKGTTFGPQRCLTK